MWDNAKRMLTAMPMRPRRQRQSAMLPWTGSPAFLYASHASTHFVKSVIYSFFPFAANALPSALYRPTLSPLMWTVSSVR